jgi:uncharacterized protein YegL
VILLHDYSGSMILLEDISQAITSHLLNLAQLASAGQQVRVAVVLFGGDGVFVLGEGDQPTAAVRALHDQVLNKWRTPVGGTPMDAALATVVAMVTAKELQGWETTVVLFTDGEPDSLTLRPTEFPEIKKRMDAQVAAAVRGFGDFAPDDIARLKARKETALHDLGTAEGMSLYRVQKELEFAKTKEYAAALRKAGVRLVTVDYVGKSAALREIHEAGGGKPRDLIEAIPASSAIEKLHAAEVLAPGGVLAQEPLRVEAAKTTERLTPVHLESIASQALVTVVFDRGVERFETQATLEALVAGRSIPFQALGDAGAALSRNGTGKVVAAHLLLDTLPPDGQVALRWRSTTLAAPACTVYVHFRLSDDLLVDLRPSHVDANARPCFTVPPTRAARWVIGLRSKTSGKAHAFKSVEVSLRDVRRDHEVRLVGVPDTGTGAFLSEPTKLPVGTYDARLRVVLPGGSQATLLLPRHVECRPAEELITLEFPHRAGGASKNASAQPGHVHWGELGDDKTKAVVELIARSRGFDYPAAVDITVDGLADSQGNSPKSGWVTVTPRTVTLEPGKAQRILLQIKVPDTIEEVLSDGPFRGVLNFTRSGDSQALPVKRFQPLAGIPDDDLPNEVAFTLRRPRLALKAPWALRDRLHPRWDGTPSLTVPVSIAQPFRRSLTFVVAHDSVLPRPVKVDASSIFLDDQDRHVSAVRIDAGPEGAEAKEVAPGGTGTFLFNLVVDGELDRRAEGTITISAPGFAPLHVPIVVEPRRPLLGQPIRSFLSVALACATALALLSALRWLWFRRCRSGRDFLLRPGQSLFGRLTFRVNERGEASLLALQPVRYGLDADRRKAPASENQPLRISLKDLTPANPLQVEQADPEGDAWRLTVRDYHETPPELHGEILEAPEESKLCGQARGRTLGWLTLAITAAIGGATLFWPTVVTACQWLLDLVTF